MDKKPEEKTCLYTNRLTEKDNPVIVLRGKLDTLNAMILEARLLGTEKQNMDFVNDLQEILEFLRFIFTTEYKCDTPDDFVILGFSSSEIQEQSHHPEKYFGRAHLLINNLTGPLCLRLNLLRTAAREAELAAVAVLHETTDMEDTADSQAAVNCRKFIIKALNRLSSLFYILMYKYLPVDKSPVTAL